MRQTAVLLTAQIAFCLVTPLWGSQDLPATTQAVASATPVDASSYTLGPGDVISINVLDVQEASGPSIRIDPSGQISLPMLGRITVNGLTVGGLEKELSSRLSVYVREPSVSVSVVEYRSQPVFVIGEVAQPGVHQLEGRKTLIEILAKAGGLKPEAGSTIRITRKAEWGVIPLPSATQDLSDQFSVAQVSITGILRATSPGDNIIILPNDVISVPRADVVYVMGEVKRPGGFTLNERRSVMALQALAMAEGFTPTAVPQQAMIIRPGSDGKRVEIAVNLREVLRGRRSDVELLPDDILLVPSSAAKNALNTAVQTALSALSSALIYGGIF